MNFLEKKSNTAHIGFFSLYFVRIMLTSAHKTIKLAFAVNVWFVEKFFQIIQILKKNYFQIFFSNIVVNYFTNIIIGVLLHDVNKEKQ